MKLKGKMGRRKQEQYFDVNQSFFAALPKELKNLGGFPTKQ